MQENQAIRDLTFDDAQAAEMLCETRDAGAAVRGNSEVMMINAEIVANATVRPAMESNPLRVDISRPPVTASAKLTKGWPTRLDRGRRWCAGQKKHARGPLAENRVLDEGTSPGENVRTALICINAAADWA